MPAFGLMRDPSTLPSCYVPAVALGAGHLVGAGALEILMCSCDVFESWGPRAPASLRVEPPKLKRALRISKVTEPA